MQNHPYGRPGYLAGHYRGSSATGALEGDGAWQLWFRTRKQTNALVASALGPSVAPVVLALCWEFWDGQATGVLTDSCSIQDQLLHSGSPTHFWVGNCISSNPSPSALWWLSPSLAMFHSPFLSTKPGATIITAACTATKPLCYTSYRGYILQRYYSFSIHQCHSYRMVSWKGHEQHLKPI